MTNESLNKAIHEWLGKEWVDVEESACYSCKRPLFTNYDGFTTVTGNPNYCQSYSDCSVFLKEITERDKFNGYKFSDKFSNEFCREIGEPHDIAQDFLYMFGAITVRHLAEAGAKAVGIWRGDE